MNVKSFPYKQCLAAVGLFFLPASLTLRGRGRPHHSAFLTPSSRREDSRAIPLCLAGEL
jgi:hypothetical protein